VPRREKEKMRERMESINKEEKKGKRIKKGEE